MKPLDPNSRLLLGMWLSAAVASWSWSPQTPVSRATARAILTYSGRGYEYLTTDHCMYGWWQANLAQPRHLTALLSATQGATP